MELFRLLGTIAIDNSDANRALNETSSNASDTANTVKEAMTRLETTIIPQDHHGLP